MLIVSKRQATSERTPITVASFEYLVHIQVTGDADSGNSSVGIWNSTGINECEVVYAADYAESGHPIAKRQAL
jgi:hypothetical protein